MQLTSLIIYPLKSGKGLNYAKAVVTGQGLLHDRQWLLADTAGQFITARTHPHMVNISVQPGPGHVQFSYPGFGSRVAFQHLYTRKSSCTVWRDRFSALHGDEMLDQWFSQVLNTPCRLLWIGQQSKRQQKNQPDPLSFADGYPYLLVNQASINALNQQLDNQVHVANFRPNLLIAGAMPYEEDEWKVIRIGGVEFEVVKLCTRCILVNVDPETGMPSDNGQPLQTLRQTRQLEQGICFGINMRALNSGQIQVGDALTVIESKYAF